VAVANKDNPQFPRLLICEGPEDKFFFERLIQIRSLPRYHIWHAGVERGAHGGNTKFAQAIETFQLERPKTFASLSKIVIAADNDESPTDSFANVCAQIDEFFGAGSAPKKALEFTKTRPPVMAMMIPRFGEKGHLEKLCGAAARDADKTIGNHVDTFMSLVKAETWNDESRLTKAWLRVDLAVRCKNDPFIPLGVLFTERRHDHLIPLHAHSSFNEIAKALS
jgi:hypothetical protein